MATECSLLVARFEGHGMGKKIPELSASQMEIMEVIWEHGELSVMQVLEKINERRSVARNTVRTLLERMEEKGWIQHREHGRTFYYKAIVPRRTSIGQKIVEIVDSWCGGDVEPLVNALIHYRGLSKVELKSLRTILADAKASSRKRQPSTESDPSNE